MEVKPGYKQTEVGVIPEEWDELTISQVFHFKQGVQSPVEQQVHFEKVGYRRFIRIVDVTDPSVPWRFISDPGPVHHVGPNDLFMVRYGSPGLLGFGHEGVIANNLFRLIPKRKIAADFYFQYLSSRKGDIADISGSSTMPAVNFSTLSGLKLVYPPPPEQRAIATALSDVDGLLGGLDRLIAKKRDLKQAAVQQLLTGQTRLPGFHGEWEVKRLDALADIRSGGTPSTVELRFWDGDIPWCTPTDITALNGHKYLGETARMITQLGLKASSAEMIPAHSVVMTSRATIGECAINAGPVSTNQGFKNFVPFATTDVDFLYYLLGTQKQGFISLCGGSTFLEIGKTQLVAYQVRLPATKAEQTAIASVLTEMDAELAALTQRREKTRALKQAMMQELLTGRTRLV